MLTPSIALPTGPYDWSETRTPLAVYERRLLRLRETMQARGLSHVIVYGNTFDHEALAWFSHFTPKLGPAVMLVAREGAPKLLFSGSPGMKPSAARLTWIADVAALRSLEKDVAAWFDGVETPRVGSICGASISLGDFEALCKGANGVMSELAFDAPTADVMDPVRASARLLQRVAEHLFSSARAGANVLQLALDAELFAYDQGAQDVRVRLARKPYGAPVTLPDAPLSLAWPAPVALAVRSDGYWAAADFLLGDVSPFAQAVRAQLETSMWMRAYANRVAFPEPPFSQSGICQVFAQEQGVLFSAPCVVDGQGPRDWLFRTPGL